LIRTIAPASERPSTRHFSKYRGWRPECAAPAKPRGRPTFNPTNEQISWAAWSWNPVTGCLHDCKYCYARELALSPSYKASYPVGFTPLFHHERLDAPANTKVPDGIDADPRLKRVFVCSMADLYGKWVPDEWIEKVHNSCIANPQWDYLMLTKFPRRYVGMNLPATAWLGTTRFLALAPTIGGGHGSAAGSFFEAELVLIFLSSLAIILPNSDSPDQIDLSLNFHGAADSSPLG
jgi:hypothetical protein